MKIYVSRYPIPNGKRHCHPDLKSSQGNERHPHSDLPRHHCRTQNAEADRSVKVIIMTGAEGRFSAGNDLDDLADHSQFPVLNQCVIDIFDCMASLTKPFIWRKKAWPLASAAIFALRFCLRRPKHSLQPALR